jgi:S1-C subfamily serine protease
MRHRPIQTILVTGIITFAVTVLLLRWDVIPLYDRGNLAQKVESAIAAGPNTQPPLSSDEEINIRVYNKVSPGVVNITATVVEYDFFFAPVARPGTGSGSVLDIEGHVLTNYHVIEPSPDNLEVALPDHTKYRAKVVGVDRQNDLAVIKMLQVPKERLHPVPLGESASLKVGQKVLAIGNPFRLQNTLTVGIISSLGRRIQTENGDLVDNIIQTDAAINPGNSGGPLLNTAGEMIGINTSIITTSGGNMGIGFAVPADTIRRVVRDLIAEGRVIRPWLGVEGYALTPELGSALDLPVTSGILVARVARGSSAENAGIRGASEIAILYNERVLIGGDIIVEVGDKAVTSMEELRLALESKKPGDSVNLTIYRGRSRIQKQMLLVEPQRQRGLRF